MLQYICIRKAAAQHVESQLAFNPMGLGYVNMVLGLTVDFPGVIARELPSMQDLHGKCVKNSVEGKRSVPFNN